FATVQTCFLFLQPKPVPPHTATTNSTNRLRRAVGSLSGRAELALCPELMGGAAAPPYHAMGFKMATIFLKPLQVSDGPIQKKRWRPSLDPHGHLLVVA